MDDFRRRGNYTILGTLMLPVLVGFGAFAVDLAWLRMAQRQCQDVADAATQAGLMVLRDTGDTGQATTAAQQVVAQNTIAGQTGVLQDIEFGTWDETNRQFTSTTDGPNAVRATVGRTGTAGVDYMLARIWGFTKADVTATSTSAGRALQVVMIVDVTGSWEIDASPANSEADFKNARDAVVEFIDTLTTSYGPKDKFAVVTFHNVFGEEWVPMTVVSGEASSHAVKQKVGPDAGDGQWCTITESCLHEVSRAGYQKTTGSRGCNAHSGSGLDNYAAGPHYAGDKSGASAHPAGGCYPEMGRYYSDEGGTDHSKGLGMASIIWGEQPNDGSYRAQVLLTDGKPANSAVSAKRAAQGYVETRFRLFTSSPLSIASVKSTSISLAQTLWDNYAVNQWVVSFKQDDPFMPAMVHGDGYYSYVPGGSATALVPIFEDIAHSLPLAVVE